MNIVYASQAQEDIEFWEKNNPKLLKRITQLLKDIKAHPFSGIGKPEPLRFKNTGYWSRRIDQEHRLVYKVVENTVYVAQCRYHYEKN